MAIAHDELIIFDRRRSIARADQKLEIARLSLAIENGDLSDKKVLRETVSLTRDIRSANTKDL